MRHAIKTSMAACTMLSGLATASAKKASTQIIGAWASCETPQACDTAPMTHVMSDGEVAVLLKKDDDLHRTGSGSIMESELTMTNDDFSLNGDGVSKTPVAIDIFTLDQTRFVSRNAEGRERGRVRCSDIEVTMGHDHDLR